MDLEQARIEEDLRGVVSGEVLCDDALRIGGTQVVQVNVDGHGCLLRGLTFKLRGTRQRVPIE